MMAWLRDYQATAFEKVRDAARRGVRRMMLQMPTGAGKTRLAAEIVNGARSKQKRVLFTVPAISLIDQTVEMFHDEGIKDVGVIQAKHHMTDWAQPIQIASVQTLRLRTIPTADVVIRDEAHILFKFDLGWMKLPTWENVPFIGMSATPWARGLGKYYHELIVGTTTAQLIIDGWLVPYRVFAPTHPDLSGVKLSLMGKGDYVVDELAKVMCEKTLMADAVETWGKHAEQRPTICFAVDCAHARALRDSFVAGGVHAEYMDAGTSINERTAIRKRFERGDVKVVCNVDVMGLGVDWPDISCISYCRPTRSEIRFVQNIGRGLRTHDNKRDLLILDHSDTTLRLGFVEDIHYERLIGGKERVTIAREKALPKLCPKCHALRVAFATSCPNCGFKPELRTTDVKHADGELVEYTELPEYKGKRENFGQKDRAQFFAELKGYAMERGYNPGWAVRKYVDKFGAPPWFDDCYNVPALTPSAGMRSWAKSTLIRYAKRSGARA
jgi:DNA repair protein RadD